MLPTTDNELPVKVAMFAVPLMLISTLELLYTVTLLLPFANAPIKFPAITLPLKFAVLPLNAKLTVKFGTTTLPEKFAVLPASSKFTVTLLVVTLEAKLAKLAVAILPKFALLN